MNQTFGAEQCPGAAVSLWWDILGPRDGPPGAILGSAGAARLTVREMQG